ncbi:MAG: KEOPS complex subunit Cgi121 [Candidatus Bathyarchaeia archaeon]
MRGRRGLLRYLEEFGRHLAIAGFKNVKITNVEDFLETVRKSLTKNVEAQFFDAEFVATWQHLYFAALNALNAFKNGVNISKSLAVEVLLYASAQRQIRKAMSLLGVKPNCEAIAVLVVGERAEDMEAALQAISKIVGGRRDDAVLELSREKIEAIRKAFEISNVELEAVVRENDLEQALVNLVIERVALLATER